MTKKVKLIYQVPVKPDIEYQITMRIGDASDGDHNVFGTCPYKTEPVDNDPEWNSVLGKGSDIKHKVLFVSSATQENNPSTNNVSVRLFINDEQVEPITGEYVLKVQEEEIAFFNQQIDFI